MTKSVEFLFDIVSPASYIAWHILPKITEAAGAELVYRPVLLGGVMHGAGNQPPGTVRAKGKWMGRDLARCAALYGLPFRRNDVFPQKTLTLMRGCVAYLDMPVFRTYGDTMFRAIHADNMDIQDFAHIAPLLEGIGLHAEEFEAATRDQAVKDRLKADTEAAVERGVFGAPTFFVDGVLHFGQDRLWMVAEDLGVDIHAALAKGSAA